MSAIQVWSHTCLDLNRNLKGFAPFKSNIVKGMMYTTADIMTKIKPEAASLMKAEVEAQWQKMEPILSAQMTQYLVVAYHYTYRNISDQELTDYNQFLLSPDGQVYWSVSIEIVNRYLKTFSENLVRKLTSTH